MAHGITWGDLVWRQDADMVRSLRKRHFCDIAQEQLATSRIASKEISSPSLW